MLWLCLPTLLAGPATLCANTERSADWQLRPLAQVDSSGIFLHQVVDSTVPEDVRLADAPPLGQRVTLSRAQIVEAARQHDPGLAPASWTGAAQTRITRRTRPLGEAELNDWLMQVLQRDYVRERGDLELRLTRGWSTTPVPDEPLTLRVLDLPVAGVTANFIVRFELRTRTELAGTWQVPLRAQVWRDVWVTRSPAHRGQLLSDAEVAVERRDLLALRDAVLDLNPGDHTLEFISNLQAGAPLTSRSLRPRPVMHRGKLVDALLQDGAMLMSVKAEALEEGVPGQLIRVRNVQSKREFRAKVENEQTVIVPL